MQVYGFDWEFYLNHYPDLKKAGICTRWGALEHYIDMGMAEGRIKSRAELEMEYPEIKDFDWRFYLKTYHELKREGIRDGWRALTHYINHGLEENRRGRKGRLEEYLRITGFDWRFYLKCYPELKDIGLDNKWRALNHYLTCGLAEGRMGKRDYLSVCAIVKNEAPYLREWIEFHKIVGVEHFYIYDNNSTDNTEELLKPYAKKGEITYTKWPQHPGQLQAYQHCLNTHGHKTKWLAYIDLDEFLHPTKQDNLKKTLKKYEKHPALAVNWQIYASNGHQKNPKGLITENYTKKAPTNYNENRHIKSIIQPQHTIEPITPHAFRYKKGECAVQEDHTEIRPTKSNHMGAMTDKVKVNVIRINHYSTMSRQEHLRSAGMLRADSSKRKEGGFFERNEVIDTTIHRFLPMLKKRLA